MFTHPFTFSESTNVRITISGNPETQTVFVVATENGTVKYAETHEPNETLKDVLDTVRTFIVNSPRNTNHKGN